MNPAQRQTFKKIDDISNLVCARILRERGDSAEAAHYMRELIVFTRFERRVFFRRLSSGDGSVLGCLFLLGEWGVWNSILHNKGGEELASPEHVCILPNMCSGVAFFIPMLRI